MFKERYPGIFKQYAAACKAGEVRVGRMFLTPTNELDGPGWVVHFPTKQDWRRPSRMEWIEEGLQDLARVLSEHAIRSIALKVQKLAWFLNCAVLDRGLDDVFKLRFQADRYGPFSRNLNHLLNSLDGSYLRSEKRISDCGPYDTIAFADDRAERVALYLRSTEARPFAEVLEATDRLIDGFQSPLGMEMLATVDWLLRREGCSPDVAAIKQALANWPGGEDAGRRKLRIFADRPLAVAVERLDRTCSSTTGNPASTN